MNDLVARVRTAGFALELTDAGPRLVPVEAGAVIPRAVLAELKERRAEVVEHLRSGREAESEGERCGVCSATVYSPTPDVFLMCRMVACPYWKPGTGPEWMAREREYRARRAG